MSLSQSDFLVVKALATEIRNIIQNHTGHPHWMFMIDQDSLQFFTGNNSGPLPEFVPEKEAKQQ